MTTFLVNAPKKKTVTACDSGSAYLFKIGEHALYFCFPAQSPMHGVELGEIV